MGRWIKMEINEQLEENGYCVVPGVVRDYEVLRDRIWTDLMGLVPGFDPRANASKKAQCELYRMAPMHSMIYQHYVGHLQSIWDVRQHQSVFNVFKNIWDTEQLYVSFDGLGVLVPPEATGRGFKRKADTEVMHVDQSPHKTGRWAVQGYINLYDADEQDATLAVVPGSHLEDRSGTVQPSNKSDWITYLGYADRAVRVPSKAGDMVLWDSRTVHKGAQPLKGRPPTSELTGIMREHTHAPRMVVYVCMLPRARLTRAQRAKRIKAFEERRMTNHWGTKLFPMHPRLYGAALPVLNDMPLPVLTALGRDLI